MYWIYQRDIIAWRNRIIQAKLLTPQNMEELKHGRNGFGFKSMLQDEPYGVKLDFTYQVRLKQPHLDSYFTSHMFPLYSERLVDLMYEYGVKFELFPATMVDMKGNELTHLRYHTFHLLEGGLDAMDETASEWQGDWRIGIPRFVLDYSKFEHRPMFRCNHTHNTLMRDDLKQEIQARKITGFGFMALEKFRSGKFGFVTNFDD